MKLADFKAAFGIGSITFGKTKSGRLVADVPTNGQGIFTLLSSQKRNDKGEITEEFDPSKPAFVYQSSDNKALWWLTNNGGSATGAVTL